MCTTLNHSSRYYEPLGEMLTSPLCARLLGSLSTERRTVTSEGGQHAHRTSHARVL